MFFSKKEAFPLSCKHAGSKLIPADTYKKLLSAERLFMPCYLIVGLRASKTNLPVQQFYNKAIYHIC